MSVECSECEHDLRGGHAESCSRYDPRMKDCTCDPEWNGLCQVHGWDAARSPSGAAKETK